jgi:transposase
MGGEKVEYGYKGKGSTVHLITDGNGSPLFITLTAANGDERLELPKLLDRVDREEMSLVEADKGYDSQTVRTEILQRGCYPLIPYRDNRKKFKKWVAQLRWKIERSFSWLKRAYRRIATRWERKADLYEAFVMLGICMYWVRKLVG